MTWDAYNRRRDAVADVLAIADRRLDGQHLYAEVESTTTAFAAPSELLIEIQMKWYQTLSGKLDNRLSVGAVDLESLTIDAWTEATQALPGARAILDAHADERALAKAFAKEHALLAQSTGVPGHQPGATAHGKRIKSAAQSVPLVAVEVPDSPAGLFTRIRGAFAA